MILKKNIIKEQVFGREKGGAGKPFLFFRTQKVTEIYKEENRYERYSNYPYL